MDKHLSLSGVCVFLFYVYDLNFNCCWHTFIWHMFVFILILLSEFNLLYTSLHTFNTIFLCYFYLAYFLTPSSCIYHILSLHIVSVYFHIFILHILYNILFKHRCIYLYGCQTHWVLVTCSDIPCIHFYSIIISHINNYNFVSVCFVCIKPSVS